MSDLFSLLQCPFHGRIIPRNKQGEPNDPVDKTRLEAEQEAERARNPNAWEDEELQRDIQVQTGKQLVRQAKGKNNSEYFIPILPSAFLILMAPLKKAILNQGKLIILFVLLNEYFHSCFRVVRENLGSFWGYHSNFRPPTPQNDWIIWNLNNERNKKKMNHALIW